MNMGESIRELILIIENDNFFRNLVARKLEEQDYQIARAVDGNEGLAKIKNQKPDLVFLSLALSEREGFKVLSEIRKDPAISSIPVIVLSNLGELEEINEALELGASDYLIKINSTPKLFLKRIKGNLK